MSLHARSFDVLKMSANQNKRSFAIFSLIRTYPLPLFAFSALFIGAVLKFTTHEPAAHFVWLAALILGGSPIVFKTVKGILRGRFASDIVAMLAIVAALLMDEAFAGAVVVLMQSGGEAIEDFGLRRATSTLKALIERAPRNAYRKIDGHIETISIDAIQIGDILVVRTGDLIPADGTILGGEGEIDESAITGEPLARLKSSGARVLSGAAVASGTIEIRADKKAQESQYAKIIDLVRKAQAEKAPIQRLADRYAIFFTPLALLVAAAGYWFTQNPLTFLSVLVVATPCPMILATPLAVICAINKAADLGIIVKGGEPIEQIAKTRAVVFDKTGTITFGTPFVQRIVSLSKIAEATILHLAAVIEQLSSHSIAKAITSAALSNSSKLPLPTQVKETPGRGIEGNWGDAHLIAGSRLFLEERYGPSLFAPFEKQIAPYIAEENILCFLVENETLLGFIVLADRIRPGVFEMVQNLYSAGIEEVTLLTGDAKKNGQAIAKLAGIRHVESELLPEQKVDAIQTLISQYRYVVMVGDGINDAPALATATVGVAMGAYGSAISAETANIVLLVDDPTRIADAIQIGKRMLNIAKQSIYIGIALSLTLMIIAAIGQIPPPIGALLQEFIDIAVILNALRAR